MDILVIFLAFISLVAILFGISIKFLDIVLWLGEKLPPVLGGNTSCDIANSSVIFHSYCDSNFYF